MSPHISQGHPTELSMGECEELLELARNVQNNVAETQIFATNKLYRIIGPSLPAPPEPACGNQVKQSEPCIVSEINNLLRAIRADSDLIKEQIKRL